MLSKRQLEEQQAKQQEVSFADVLPLHVFQWLLDSAQAAKVKKISSEIALKSKREAEAMRASSSSSIANRSKKTPESDAKQMVAALFKK